MLRSQSLAALLLLLVSLTCLASSQPNSLQRHYKRVLKQFVSTFRHGQYWMTFRSNATIGDEWQETNVTVQQQQHYQLGLRRVVDFRFDYGWVRLLYVGRTEYRLDVLDGVCTSEQLDWAPTPKTDLRDELAVMRGSFETSELYALAGSRYGRYRTPKDFPVKVEALVTLERPTVSPVQRVIFAGADGGQSRLDRFQVNTTVRPDDSLFEVPIECMRPATVGKRSWKDRLAAWLCG